MQKQLREPTQPFLKDKEYPRHTAAHPKGGFHMSYVNDTKNSEVVKSIVKQIGGKLLKGEIQNIMSLSKPAALCKDLTYMEIVANDLINVDYLKLAATKPLDPLFQMKCVVTHILVKSDGTLFFAECTNPNPPQAIYHVIGPEKCYQIYGNHQVKASVAPSMNSLNGSAYGVKSIDFGNGNIFECEYNLLQISGLVMGDRIMHLQKSFKVRNPKTHIVADIKFLFDNSVNVTKVASQIGSFLGLGKKDQKAKRKADDFDVIIEKVQDMDGEEFRALLSSGTGNWLEYIQFDDVVFWTVDQKQEPWSYPAQLLPSDCTLRVDRALITKGQLEIAEKQKLLYEDRDRKDKEMRNKAKKAASKLQKS